jgi:hypothetical protein
MIPFGVFETSESEIDSPHARTAGCAVSLGATATYRFTSSGQRHAMGVRLGRNSVPPSSFIYRAVLILRRRVRLALLGTRLYRSNFYPRCFTGAVASDPHELPQMAGSSRPRASPTPAAAGPHRRTEAPKPPQKGRASPLTSFGIPVISRSAESQMRLIFELGTASASIAPVELHATTSAGRSKQAERVSILAFSFSSIATLPAGSASGLTGARPFLQVSVLLVVNYGNETRHRCEPKRPHPSDRASLRRHVDELRP